MNVVVDGLLSFVYAPMYNQCRLVGLIVVHV